MFATGGRRLRLAPHTSAVRASCWSSRDNPVPSERLPVNRGTDGLPVWPEARRTTATDRLGDPSLDKMQIGDLSIQFKYKPSSQQESQGYFPIPPTGWSLR